MNAGGGYFKWGSWLNPLYLVIGKTRPYVDAFNMNSKNVFAVA